MALPLAQAAERLDLPPATLRSQIRTGRLRGKLVGMTWTVTAGELERYRRDSLGRRRRR
jgi:hypothetical protein